MTTSRCPVGQRLDAGDARSPTTDVVDRADQRPASSGSAEGGGDARRRAARARPSCGATRSPPRWSDQLGDGLARPARSRRRQVVGSRPGGRASTDRPIRPGAGRSGSGSSCGRGGCLVGAHRLELVGGRAPSRRGTTWEADEAVVVGDGQRRRRRRTRCGRLGRAGGVGGPSSARRDRRRARRDGRRRRPVGASSGSARQRADQRRRRCAWHVVRPGWSCPGARRTCRSSGRCRPGAGRGRRARGAARRASRTNPSGA